MAARTVDGPEEDWLDLRDLVKLTRLSESTINRLIRSGEFPRAKQVSPGVQMWHWTDYLYWSLRVAIRDRLTPDKSPEPAES